MCSSFLKLEKLIISYNIIDIVSVFVFVCVCVFFLVYKM